MRKFLTILVLMSINIIANGVTIGTPFTRNATKVLMLGAGELGKEVIIELQRLGVEVIAIDRYENAPGMQVAHRSYVISMLDGEALYDIIIKENPTFIVPEIEAIATDTLLTLEQQGFTVIPTARAAKLTMDREGIRRVASEKLHLQTSSYCFASNEEQFLAAVKQVGIPFVVKPIMSSSGKGQSIVKNEQDITKAWYYAQEGGRAGHGKVIVEEFIDFDYEITLLTIRHANGTSYCKPIGHRQVNGDYRESWQPQPMNEIVFKKAHSIAKKITDELGGYGVFGVEMFVKGDEVYFSEVSPRPHDTGLVTLISQDISQFGLHARAILGLPIPNITFHGPSASYALIVSGTSENITYCNIQNALTDSDTQLRLFGKPNVCGERRMGVVVSRGKSILEARKKARKAVASIEVSL